MSIRNAVGRLTRREWLGSLATNPGLYASTVGFLLSYSLGVRARRAAQRQEDGTPRSDIRLLAFQPATVVERWDDRVAVNVSSVEGLAESYRQPSPWHGRQLRTIRRPSVSVVIPALNEADNLPTLLTRMPDWVDEVLLVDGHSTDDTAETARRFYPEVRIVDEETKGKGAALRRGFAEARGDIVVMLDADNSMDPAEIPAFVGALLAGADFVKGSRFLQGAGTADMPWYRKMGNWGFVMMVRLFFGGRFSDLLYGYNAFWRSLLPIMDLDGDGFEIETMMNVRALRAGLKVVEVPSFEDKRKYGESRLRTFPDGWRVLMTILRERFLRRQPTLDSAPYDNLRQFREVTIDRDRLSA